MQILFGFLWGILTPVIMALTIQYWLPVLSREKEASASAKEETSSGLGQYLPQSRLLREKRSRMLLLILSGVLAFACGYFAASYTTGVRWFVSLWLAFSVLACISITDWEFYLIPNKCSLALLLGGCLLLIWEWIAGGAFPAELALESVIALAVSLMMLLLLSFVSRGGIGMGDVKIACSLAFVCGLRAVCYILVVALLCSAVFSSGLLLTKKKQLKDLLPLGPFMWLAISLLILLKFI